LVDPLADNDMCDGIDADCDGLTDEDEATGATCGPCDNGQYQCIGGSMQCSGGDVPTSEVCDGVDNNCDGSIDEGLFRPCGGCDSSVAGQEYCSDVNEGDCVQGIQYCAAPVGAGYEDESFWGVCLSSNDPVSETCDGYDNNCDGSTDESLTAPLLEDVCIILCPLTKTAFCAGGQGWMCDYHCTDETNGQVECYSIQTVSDPDGTPHVTGTPVSAETICDEKDNDCDLSLDEFTNKDFDVNNCGSCGNDCTTAPAWLPGSRPTNVETFGCYGGNCIIAKCNTGYWDNENITGPDCNVGPCSQTNGGVELCDDVDNDCDGSTDEGFSGITEACNGIDDDCDDSTDELDPPVGACRALGACAGATATCGEIGGGNYGWVCGYTGDVDHSSGVFTVETRCDGIDNDCDGMTDEDFDPLPGNSCDNGGVGQCYESGKYRCKNNWTTGDKAVCCASWTGAMCDTEVSSGDPIDQTGTVVETDCNGKDDDCDGYIDEGVGATQSYTTIKDDPTTPTWTFSIFNYEASRPDALAYTGDPDDNEPGTATAAACSVVDKVPWTMVNEVDAQKACWKLNPSGDQEAGGWDLCSKNQWEYACQYSEGAGVNSPIYPYDTSYQSDWCNGHDTYATDDYLIGTGWLDQCIAGWNTSDNVYDMSGNVEEWTRSTRQVGTDTLFEIRGGSYNDLGGGMACDFDFWAAQADFTMPNLGFRCCSGDEPVGACSVDGDCDTGFYCETPKCVSCDTDLKCGPTCVTCLGDEHCIAGSCQLCSQDTSCGADCDDCTLTGEVCAVDGSTASCEECADSSDCNAGEGCTNNVCVSCSDTVTAIANHPWDFEDDSGGCSNDGWTMDAPYWVVGTSTIVTPDGVNDDGNCVLGTILDDVHGNYWSEWAETSYLSLEACSSSTVILHFVMILDIEERNSTRCWDWLRLSAQNGSGTTTLYPTPGYWDTGNDGWCGEQTGSTPFTDWIDYSVDVSAYMTDSDVRFRFLMDTDSNTVYYGAYIDYVWLEVI
jgi:Sulfatase-modifying factor enzyme 1/Putative metal-binding motif